MVTEQPSTHLISRLQSPCSPWWFRNSIWKTLVLHFFACTKIPTPCIKIAICKDSILYFLIICIIILWYHWSLNFLGIKDRVGAWTPNLQMEMWTRRTSVDGKSIHLLRSRAGVWRPKFLRSSSRHTCLLEPINPSLSDNKKYQLWEKCSCVRMLQLLLGDCL